MVKNLTANAENIRDVSLTPGSIFAWRIPWTEDSGGVHIVHMVTYCYSPYCHTELDVAKEM